ncbi:oxidoreductase [Rahnella victoriana]|jgi:predicted dehydrogenase|uniref:oxidoreductase n=1 Tax=Rahnella victoriana TaxID=1510570 RepID=UPI000E6C044D|nr:oxidoreductase [Rahnella victoriana]TBX32374.1 oxidoreductase [Rahnella victoriana]UHM90197.1 oxidoreductase [Rahnella victoriana]
MTQTLRVGLVGYGFASKTFHSPLIDGTPGLELAVVSSSDAGKVHADWPHVAVVDSPEKLFADASIDLVVIPTPNTTHFPLAKLALEAGKHVIVDKPFTVTLEEARELDVLAREKGKVLSVFHNRRWDSDFLTVKALINEGALGDIVYFESHYDRYKPQVMQRWRESDAPGSGIWFDLGSHLLDQALQLFGTPDALQADLAVLRPGGKAVDYFNAVLTYPRRRVVLHSTVYAVAETARFIVQGEKGSYVKFGLDPQEDRLKAGERLPQPDWGFDKRDGVITLSHDGVLAEKSLLTIPGDYPAYYAGVRDAINGQGDNPVPAADAIRVMEMLELGMQSSEQQATLKVIKN